MTITPWKIIDVKNNNSNIEKEYNSNVKDRQMESNDTNIQNLTSRPQHKCYASSLSIAEYKYLTLRACEMFQRPVIVEKARP